MLSKGKAIDIFFDFVDFQILLLISITNQNQFQFRKKKNR